MPLTLNPRKIEQRAEFYLQASQLIAAGVSILDALRIVGRNPPDKSSAAAITQVMAQVQAGSTFSKSLRSTGSWLPPFDLALLEAGEQSGRLPECMQLLAGYHQENARLIRRVIADLIYPLLVVHLAVFLMPIKTLVLCGDLFSYMKSTVGLLAPFYLIAFSLIYFFQSRQSATAAERAKLEKLLFAIPVLGKALHLLAVARLSAALGALLNAGVTVIEAWQIAARASGSGLLEQAVKSWTPSVQAGMQPSEAVAASGVFPDTFSHLYHSGEASGRLDHTLQDIYRITFEEGTRKLRLFATWIPRIVYFIVLFAIAYMILSAGMAYFNMQSEIINSIK